MDTKTTQHFDSVKIASDRRVNLGHEIENFSRRAVVLAYRPADGFLQVQETRGGELVPGSVWFAAPHLCK